MHETESAESQGQRPTNTQPLAFAIVVVTRPLPMPAVLEGTASGGHEKPVKPVKAGRCPMLNSRASLPLLTSRHLGPAQGRRRHRKTDRCLLGAELGHRGRKLETQEERRRESVPSGARKRQRTLRRWKRRLCDFGHDHGP